MYQTSSIFQELKSFRSWLRDEALKKNSMSQVQISFFLAVDTLNLWVIMCIIINKITQKKKCSYFSSPLLVLEHKSMQLTCVNNCNDVPYLPKDKKVKSHTLYDL